MLKVLCLLRSIIRKNAKNTAEKINMLINISRTAWYNVAVKIRQSNTIFQRSILSYGTLRYHCKYS